MKRVRQVTSVTRLVKVDGRSPTRLEVGTEPPAILVPNGSLPRGESCFRSAMEWTTLGALHWSERWNNSPSQAVSKTQVAEELLLEE